MRQTRIVRRLKRQCAGDKANKPKLYQTKPSRATGKDGKWERRMISVAPFSNLGPFQPPSPFSPSMSFCLPLSCVYLLVLIRLLVSYCLPLSLFCLSLSLINDAGAVHGRIRQGERGECAKQGPLGELAPYFPYLHLFASPFSSNLFSLYVTREWRIPILVFGACAGI